MGLSHEEASELHHRYYAQYGLALRGLKRNHDVGNVVAKQNSTHMLISLADVLDFDRKCDGSLPLENMISYNPTMRKLFEDIDRSKARVWALTNAYKPVGTFFLPHGISDSH
jgi:pyrimidine and pyridine-specific 5'-nucleotidase